MKKLKAEINATIDVKFASWANMSRNTTLIFASGEIGTSFIQQTGKLLQRAGYKAGLLGIHARSAGDPCAHDGQHVSRSVGTGEGGLGRVYFACLRITRRYLQRISGARAT